MNGDGINLIVGAEVIEAAIDGAGRRTVFDNGDLGGNDLPIGRGANRAGQGNVQSFIHIDRRIIDDGNVEGSVSLAGSKGEDIGRTDVVQAVEGGAVSGEIRDRNGPGAAKGAQHGDSGVGSVFRKSIAGGVKTKGARAHVVIQNGQGGGRPRAEGGAADRVAQNEAQDFGLLDDGIVNDGHHEGFGGCFPVGPGKDARGSDVVTSGQSGAVKGGISDTDSTLTAESARDGDSSGQIALADRVIGGTEVEIPVDEIVIDNGQSGRVGNAKGGAASGGGEGEDDSLIGLGCVIRNDGHVKGLDCLAITEGENAAGGDVILAGLGDAVDGRIMDRDNARSAVVAQDGDSDIGVVFVDGVSRGIEIKFSGGKIIVHNGEGGEGQTQGAAAGGIGQGEQNGFIAFDQQVIENRNGKSFDDFAGCKGEGVAHGDVIQTGGGGAVLAEVID